MIPLLDFSLKIARRKPIKYYVKNIITFDRFGGLFLLPENTTLFADKRCTNKALGAHRQGLLFLRKFEQKEGLPMHDFISRLIDCGMPRKVAACVCADFQRRGKLVELAQYVDEVEKETYGGLEAV